MAYVWDDFDGQWVDDGEGGDEYGHYGTYTVNIGGDNFTQKTDGTWEMEDENGKKTPITQEQLTAIVKTANLEDQSVDPTLMATLRDPSFKAKLQDPSFVQKLNNAFGTNKTGAEFLKMGAVGIGGLMGAMGAGNATVKPTGYQGGIPQLTASQPMLTEPPPGRRPGSGGINYGTGVQYKDAKGNIVSDTSTPVADLYNKATQQGTYNNWGHQYGQGTTGGGLTNLPSGGNTGGTDNSALIAQLRALLAARGGSTGGPAAGSGVVNPPVNNGIATGIDVNRPWAKASSDPTIKAAQDALEQLSKTQGTPEQRQAALTNFLKTTKYTPAQLAAATNGQWGVQDLINQMQGNTNVFNTQTPWSIYSTQADTKAVQDALQQLSQTKGTPEERQAALTNFLKTTKYTPAQLAAASNGMWSVADLSRQMAGNPNLTAANTVDPSHPWTTASSDQTIQGAQAALAKLNATTGTPAERQAALVTFLKTTTYTPAQLAAATNGQWGVADLTAQMAGNPVLQQASNAPAGSTPAGGGFVTGGGYTSQADYDKAVAIKKAQDAKDQAALDAYHIAPNSPFYKYVQDPKSIPHLYGESDADALKRVKINAKEYDEQQAGRSAQSSTFAGSQFAVSGGGIKDVNGKDVLPGPDETDTVIVGANGVPRYAKKTEAAAQAQAKQQYLMDQGNIVDPNKPWNVASTDTGTQSAQAALAKLNATTGTPAERQAALQNFLKTTTFTPEQLSAATNGQWAVSDLKSQMAGNSNLLDQGSPIVEDKASAGSGDVGNFENQMKKLSGFSTPTVNEGGGLGGIATTKSNFTPAPQDLTGLAALAGQTSTPMAGVSTAGIPKTGNQEIDPNSIWQNPGSPVAPTDPFQQIYGRSATPEEAAWAASQSPEMVQNTLTSSLADWNASHPKTMAQGGLTNLDHGGFVIPADVVSHFGNGSSSAGLELLAQNMGAEPIRGQGDGMSDSIPAAIDGREKALVANDEAYLSPQMVQRLGGGSMDKGSQKLAHMMEKIRQARTGSKEQGKQINPNNFMPGGTVGYAQGGGIKSYAGTTDPTASLVQAGVTGTEQNLSNWSGPAVTQMLGQAQALANTPYQAYTGPLTAGASDLQTQAFNTAANLPVGGGMATDFAQQAGNLQYTPQTTNFGTAQAQQYMNPYLQASLNPQLDEARRQSEITNQQNNAAMTKAGAFGGGRQAIMTSENQRNLGTNLANITGTGYNTAYDKAMAQFNADQNRQMQENQFVNTSKLAGLNTGISGLSTANQMGINNLKTQADLGLTQRGIESEGIAADKKQFEEARVDPYSKLQFQQSMFNGLPITAQNYNMSQPNALQGAAGGAKTINDLLAALGIKI